jgi:Tol biopolymer transport system component
MPFSDQKAKLVVYDLESKTSQELGEFSLQVRHSGPEEKELTIITPDWSPGGEYLYITDNKGIHRVTFGGERVLLVQREGLRNVVWAPHGSQVAYTEGKNLFLNNAEGKQEINVTAQSSSFATLAENDVRKLAYSPDGLKLAVGARNRLIVFDLATNAAIMTHKSRDPIYWISWLPAGDRLVFLTGLPTHRDRAGDVGYYNLFQISAQGTDRAELYKDRYLDVRDACPSLSSDGRYLAMIAKPVRGYDQVFVVATDGSGSVQLTSKGRCASPSWRPRTVQ